MRIINAFELEVLKHMAGLPSIATGGAAYWAALEALKSAGLITTGIHDGDIEYRLSDAGRALVNAEGKS